MTYAVPYFLAFLAASSGYPYYRSGGTWLVHASCTTDNPNLHR